MQRRVNRRHHPKEDEEEEEYRRDWSVGWSNEAKMMIGIDGVEWRRS